MPVRLAGDAKRSVVPGEACTELGFDVRQSAPVSWIERWFRPQAMRARR
jgi:hypothetical protein